MKLKSDEIVKETHPFEGARLLKLERATWKGNNPEKYFTWRGVIPKKGIQWIGTLKEMEGWLKNKE